MLLLLLQVCRVFFVISDILFHLAQKKKQAGQFCHDLVVQWLLRSVQVILLGVEKWHQIEF